MLREITKAKGIQNSEMDGLIASFTFRIILFFVYTIRFGGQTTFKLLDPRPTKSDTIIFMEG